MAGASGGALAANVTAAGGFGFIGVDLPEPSTKDTMMRELSLARSILKLAPDAKLPIGMGFLGWTLDNNPQAVELVTLALESRVQAIWFSFGENLGKWIKLVRDLEERRGRGNQEKTLIFAVVNSVPEAIRAVNDWKADVIVAQGTEAGGHGSATSPPLLTLLPDILRTLPSSSLPVIGAGGLTHGSHLAALLALGASGMVIGTRFLVTPECLWPESKKSLLIAAPSSQSTARSFAWDVARRITGWPKGIDGRALKNQLWADYEGGVSTGELNRRHVANAVDPEMIVIWAGIGIGAVNQLMNSADIVVEVALEATAKLQATPGLLSARRVKSKL